MSISSVILRFTSLRFYFVKLRYLMFRHKLRVHHDRSADIGDTTIEHNLGAFVHDAAFGCGGRMGLLIYPVIAFYSFYTNDRAKLRVLMVGCRSEDDVYWMRSYGFSNTIGFDLFSYSRNVLVGDIHHTDFLNETFDVVILGWMISYTKDPGAVVKECRRILKPGGLLGIGIEHDPSQVGNAVTPPRVNSLNSSGDIIALLNETVSHKILFEYDHCNQDKGDFSTAVVSRCE